MRYFLILLAIWGASCSTPAPRRGLPPGQRRAMLRERLRQEWQGHPRNRRVITAKLRRMRAHFAERANDPRHRADPRAEEERLAVEDALAEIEASERPTTEAPRPTREAALAAAAPAPARSEVAQPAYRFPEDAKRFAVVVGVEKYTDLPQATYAERDAEAVRAHLRALGYPERNIIFLAGERASRAGLSKNLESWLPMNAPEGATVFFYFSGHGAPDPKTGEAYLLPRDGDPQFLEETAYPLKRLYAKLDALKADRVVVALDACFSGAGGRSVIAKGTRPLVTKLELAPGGGDKVVSLAAAGADQVTGSFEEKGHGLFTYFLLKGLNERRGDSTLRELYEYLLPHVQDEARRSNRLQTPQVWGPASEARLR